MLRRMTVSGDEDMIDDAQRAIQSIACVYDVRRLTPDALTFVWKPPFSRSDVCVLLSEEMRRLFPDRYGVKDDHDCARP